MNGPKVPDSGAPDSESDERVREQLDDDDSSDEPVSEDALVDADSIGTALRDR
jgi:hypothetical protein